MNSPEQTPDSKLQESLQRVVNNVLATLLGDVKAWYLHCQDTLKHFQEIPEGVELELPDGTIIVMEGAALQAFQAGMIVAQEILGKIPLKLDRIPDTRAEGDPADSPEATDQECQAT